MVGWGSFQCFSSYNSSGFRWLSLIRLTNYFFKHVGSILSNFWQFMNRFLYFHNHFSCKYSGIKCCSTAVMRTLKEILICPQDSASSSLKKKRRYFGIRSCWFFYWIIKTFTVENHIFLKKYDQLWKFSRRKILN